MHTDRPVACDIDGKMKMQTEIENVCRVEGHGVLSLNDNLSKHTKELLLLPVCPEMSRFSRPNSYLLV